MKNSRVVMSHHDPLSDFNLATEQTTFPILTDVKFLYKQRIQTMRYETSAVYNIPQRPPPLKGGSNE